jgi:hypothetical protein
MNLILKIVVILGILVLVAGCSHPADTSSGNGSATPAHANFSVPVTPENTLTPTPPSVFPSGPVILPPQYRSTEFMGSFENSFIESDECSNGSESFATNYTLFTASGDPRSIHYTLSAVDNTGNLAKVPLPSDILNASITPDDFVALPDHIYSSRVVITVGPNVTGESHTNPDGSGWYHNPSFPFVLNVTVDGLDAPGADDQLTVTKVCYFTPQTREMQPSPDIEANIPDIILKPGDGQSANVTIRNFGGGIRELHFEIPARINGSNWTFPLEADPAQLMPIPEGMHFTLTPLYILGRNFRSYNDTLQIATTTATPPGNYTFPLVLCYRNLDPDNTTSLYFPFDGNSYCDTAAQFTVDIVE